MQQTSVKYAEIQGSDVTLVTGRKIPDVATILIVTPAGATVDMFITLDEQAIVDAGTAEWFLHKTIPVSTNDLTIFEYGPTAIRLTPSAAGAKAWFKV